MGIHSKKKEKKMERAKKKQSVFRAEEEIDKANRIREQYKRKGLTYRYTRERNIAWKYWNIILEDYDYTFEFTMKYFLPEHQVPPSLLAELSYFLANDNAIWKKWFYRDFLGLIAEIMPGKREEAQVPSWINMMVVNLSRENAHRDDALFVNVPWRRFYMWCRAMCRSAEKYVIGMYLSHHDTKFLPGTLPKRNDSPVYKQARDKAFSDIFIPSKGHILFEHTDTNGQRVTKNYTHVPLSMRESRSNYLSDSKKGSIIFVLWQTYRLFSTSTKKRYFPPNDDIPFLYKVSLPAEKEGYTYNFGIQHVVCFMYWYIVTMIDLGKFDKYKIGDPNYIPVVLTRQQKAVRGSGTRYVNKYIVDIAKEEGYLVIDEQGNKRWPLLENLPLAPRRFGGPKDEERRGVLFLGEEMNE